MSDTSVGSERSVDVSIGEDVVEVRDAGVQTHSRSPRNRLSSSCSDSSTGSPEVMMPNGDYMGHPRVPWEEKLNRARSFKQDGNDKYKTGMFKAAIGKYHRALFFLKGIKDAQQGLPLMPVMEDGDAEKPKGITEQALDEVTQLQCDCYNNLSACILHTSSPVYSKVLQYSENVLQIAPCNTKALYRKGVALYHLKDPENALIALEKAHKQPGGDTDKNIIRYMQYCAKQMQEQDKKLKKTYQNMFETLAVADEEDVFTDNTDDPNIVQPQRKLEKASSIA